MSQLGGRAVLNGTDLYGFRPRWPVHLPTLAGLLFTPFADFTVTAGSSTVTASMHCVTNPALGWHLAILAG